MKLRYMYLTIFFKKIDHSRKPRFYGFKGNLKKDCVKRTSQTKVDKTRILGGRLWISVIRKFLALRAT